MTQQPDPRQELSEWWEKVAHLDMHKAMDKAEEYGSMDLAIMGKAMEGLFPGSDTMDLESRRRLGVEMAIAFYHLGKAARTFGAYVRGVVPSDDTWHDAVVYAMMVRRVRDSGDWPYPAADPAGREWTPADLERFREEMDRLSPRGHRTWVGLQDVPPRATSYDSDLEGPASSDLRRDREEDDEL